jgi:hypothetical protein
MVKVIKAYENFQIQKGSKLDRQCLNSNIACQTQFVYEMSSVQQTTAYQTVTVVYSQKRCAVRNSQSRRAAIKAKRKGDMFCRSV